MPNNPAVTGDTGTKHHHAGLALDNTHLRISLAGKLPHRRNSRRLHQCHSSYIFFQLTAAVAARYISVIPLSRLKIILVQHAANNPVLRFFVAAYVNPADAKTLTLGYCKVNVNPAFRNKPAAVLDLRVNKTVLTVKLKQSFSCSTNLSLVIDLALL
ncbi:hypothetical protein ES703_94895 [subsurface metagenome]